MPQQTITLQELNRTTLSRQLLLEPATLSPTAAIEHFVGLQAQRPISPYIALRTRLQDFQRDDLATLIGDRSVIKATMMRVTLHLVTKADYLHFRGALKPALDDGLESILKQRDSNFDREQVLQIVRDFLSESPRTFAEISEHLTTALPDVDVGAMRYTARTQLPLVQVPVKMGWSYPGRPQFALAESWLGEPIPTDAYLRDLIWRYLAAFGPASYTDFQKWSGLSKMRDAFNDLRPELMVYQEETGRELFDLPDLALIPADTPAPVRFLPEYDNLLLSHDKRTRIIDDAYRKQVYLPGLRVRSTFLVDGFVAGGWTIEKKRGQVTMQLEPFTDLTKGQRDELAAEADRLARFVEADAKGYDVTFTA